MASVWPQHVASPEQTERHRISRWSHGLAMAVRGIGSRRTLSVLTWCVVLAGGAVIGLLALRIWLQLTGDTAAGGLTGLLYGLSGHLTAPFSAFEPATPVRDNGILEFSTLVALEAYLIATMVALTVLFSARLALLAVGRVAETRRRSHVTAMRNEKSPA